MAGARILAYHSLSPLPGDRLGITPHAFRRQMSWLAAQGWQCLSLEAWLDHVEAGTQPRRPSFVLTFDDGYAGLLDQAAPVILANGWTATVFVVTDALATGSFPARSADGSHSPLAGPPRGSFTWREAEDWLRMGFSIGNHTRTHPRLTQIRGDSLHEEIAGAAAALRSRLGVRRPAFCYPFGEIDDVVAGVVRDTGHRCGVVTPSVVGLSSGRWSLHRVGVYHESLGRFRFKLCRPFPVLRSMHHTVTRRRARPHRLPPGARVNVLQVTSGREIGGIERMMPRLVSSLRNLGVEASVLSARPGGSAEELLRNGGTPTLGSGWAGGFLSQLLRLRRILRAEIFDAVHVYGGRATALSRLAIVGMGDLRPRIITGILSTDHAGGRAKRVLEFVTGRWNDIYISNSWAGARAAREKLAFGHGRITLVHDGIEREPDPTPAPRDRTRDLLSIPRHAQLLICVANMRPMKGHRVLLNAFGGLRDDPMPTHLILVGRDCMGGKIRRLASRNPAAARIHILGMRSDVEDLLAASDVFVLASDWEGLPVSILEAMRAGLPVVATAVSGIPEAIEHGVHGLLVPPGRVGALRTAMEEMLADPLRARRMGSAARARFQRQFTIDRMSRNLANIYRAPLACGRGVSTGSDIVRRSESVWLGGEASRALERGNQ